MVLLVSPPLRGTRIIHSRFEQHHRPALDTQYTAECRITTPPSAGVFDEASGRTVYPDPELVYDGPCKLGRSSNPAGTRVAGDRTVTIAEYVLSLPKDAADAAVPVHAVVTMTRSPQNADLVGQVLTVTNPRFGSITWQRDIVCELQPPPTAR